MLYSCSGFGNASVAPLLTFRERFVRISFSLYLVAIAVLFQPGFPLFGGVTAICIDIFAGVPCIEDVFKVLAIMPTGCVGLDLPDHFVFLIYVDGEFVTIVVFAMLFWPSWRHYLSDDAWLVSSCSGSLSASVACSLCGCCTASVQVSGRHR